MTRKRPTMGRGLASLRHALGLTQDELAHVLGATAITISRWERNVSQPSPVIAKALLAFVGTKPHRRHLARLRVVLATPGEVRPCS